MTELYNSLWTSSKEIKNNRRRLDQYLKYHVPDAERRIYTARQKDFVLRRNLLYLRVTPKKSNEDVLVFVVPGLKRQAAMGATAIWGTRAGTTR